MTAMAATPSWGHHATVASTQAPLSVVIDSNVWVSLLIYEDIRFQQIQMGLQAGWLRALASVETRSEWRAVLRSGRFPRREFDDGVLLQRFDALTTMCEVFPEACVALPRCRDRHDQKFLELAYCGVARVVVTDDQKVLASLKKSPFKPHCFGCKSLVFERELARCREDRARETSSEQGC